MMSDLPSANDEPTAASTPVSVGAKRQRCDLSGSFLLEGHDGEPCKLQGSQLIGMINSVVRDAMEEAVESAISRIEKALVYNFGKRITLMEQRIQELELDNKGKSETISAMSKTIDAIPELHLDQPKFDELYNYIHFLESEINDVAQYTRKNNIKIFGLPEKKEEDCVDEVSKLLSNSLHLNDITIEVAHRLGRKKTMADTVKGAKPRPMIVRLLKRNDKMSIMRSRRQLKDTKIFIHEDLTRTNENLLRCARDHPTVNSAWAWNAKVLASDIRGKIHEIRMDTDMDSFIKFNKLTVPHYQEESSIQRQLAMEAWRGTCKNIGKSDVLEIFSNQDNSDFPLYRTGEKPDYLSTGCVAVFDLDTMMLEIYQDKPENTDPVLNVNIRDFH